MDHITPTVWKAARQALERAFKLHLEDPNVWLIDLGLRDESCRADDREPELAVRVHVRKKLRGREFQSFVKRYPKREISRNRIGFPVEVIQADYQLQRGLQDDASEEALSPFGLAPVNPEQGSWWGLVVDRRSGAEMILSTWHTLAGARKASTSSPIYFVSPQHSGAEIFAQYARDAMHVHLDAAVATLVCETTARELKAGMPEIEGVGIPQLGMLVGIGAGEKARGRITGILGCGWQVYGGRRRLIRHTVHISPLAKGESICAAGDSGAWWLEAESGCVVGLHFAGCASSGAGLALAMPEVLQALEVDLAPRAEAPLSGYTQHETEKQLHGAALSQKLEVFLSLKSLWASVFASLCLVLLGFDQYMEKQIAQHAVELERLRLHAAQLARTAMADSLRRQHIQKIIGIIDRYNPRMRSDLKFGLASEIYAMSLKYPNLSLEFICATITHESAKTWEPRVVSPVGALGLMQIMPATGRMLAEAEGIAWTSAEEVLFEPFVNIRLGCRYLSQLVAAYSMDGGLAAYNGGERRAERWLDSGRAPGILVAETENYVPAILKIYNEYQRLNSPN